MRSLCTFPYMNLEGRTALLTGATGGLGQAIANALAARGARLILSSRKTEELVKLARSLPGTGHTTLTSDLADDGAALALLEQAGDIDVLVANAALPASGQLDGFSQEQIGRALRVNLESPVRMTRELLPGWQERGSGHFVFISSISGFASTPRAPCTRRRSSACAASHSTYERTCAARALAFQSSRRVRFATPECSPIAAPRRHPGSAQEHPRRLAMPWCARSSTTSRKSVWRHFVSERLPASP